MKNFKKVLAVFLAALTIFSVTPLIEATVPVAPIVSVAEAKSKVKLNKKKLTLVEGNSFKLKVKGTKKKVKWSSSNKKIATVKKGKVVAKKAGKATITAKVGKKKYKCKVTVKPIPATVKKISATYYNLGPGGGVVGVLKNNNKTAVDVVLTILYYKNGNLVDTKSEENYCLEKGRSCALCVNAPYDSDYNNIQYTSYKATLKVEPVSDSMLPHCNIVNIESVNTGDKIISTVKNIGSKKIGSAQLAVVYFDSNNKCIGYDYHYAEIESAGAVDYINFDYPHDSNYDTIKPASYKVYLNSAYSYDWEFKN